MFRSAGFSPAVFMKGFFVSTFSARLVEGTLQLSEWLNENKKKSVENVVGELENSPEAFIRLFGG